MLNKNIKFLTLIMILSILFTPLTHATQSRLINFQGRLTDQQGNTLDGTYNIIFSIYASATDTDPLWTEEHMDVSVSKGLVNVLLGSITSLDIPTKVTFDQKRYLGIRIDCDNNPINTEPEMFPRQMILPAIYSYNADKLDGKDGSEYTTPTTDAGRVDVVDDLYERNMKLSEKYLEKEVGGNINGGVNIAGNVGIGITNPSQKLDINGDMRVRNKASCEKLYTDSLGKVLCGTDDDKPDSDSEVPDNISINNERLYAPLGNGNVGIGTASPGEKLSVAGIIESTSGGIKFPDGTVQTTADYGYGPWSYPSTAHTAATEKVLLKCPDGYYLAGISFNFYGGWGINPLTGYCRRITN